MTRAIVLPDNVDTAGNLTLLAAPMSTITNWPPKLTDLTKVTTKDITYSLPNDGWAHGKSQEDTTDERLTLRTTLGGFGKVTHDVSLTYYYGTATDVVDPIAIEGQLIFIAARYATPYEQDFSATDKWDIFKLIAGTKVRNPPAANGKFTRVQKFKPRAAVLEDVTLLAS